MTSRDPKLSPTFVTTVETAMSCHIFSISPFSMLSQIFHNWHFHCLFIPGTFYSLSGISGPLIGYVCFGIDQKLSGHTFFLVRFRQFRYSHRQGMIPKIETKLKFFSFTNYEFYFVWTVCINHYLHLEMSHLLLFVICTWFVCTKYRTEKKMKKFSSWWVISDDGPADFTFSG